MSKVLKGTKTISERIARAVLWVFTGAIPVFIAACYGPAEGYGADGGWRNELAARGKVLNGLTLDPVQDIKLSCMVNGVVVDSTYSLPGDGVFELWYEEGSPCDAIVAEDVDGQENGAFAPVEVPFDPSEEETVVELSSETPDAGM